MVRPDRHAIERPYLTVAVAGAVTAALALGVTRLQLRTDGLALVPARAPAVAAEREVRETFGIQDPLVVLVRASHPGGVFNGETLRLIRDLTHELQALDGVDAENVRSLATETGFRFRPGTLQLQKFLEEIPRTDGAMEALRDDVRSIRLFSGTFVSFDERAAAILVGIPRGRDRQTLVASVRRAVARHGPTGDEVHVLGAPIAESQLGTHILRDLGVPGAAIDAPSSSPAAPEPPAGPGLSIQRVRSLVAGRIGLLPLTLTIMAVVLALVFRSPAAVALPLVEILAALAATLGLMGWLGVPLYLTTTVVPVILTAAAVAEEIHIFSRYAQERRARPDADIGTCVRVSLDELRSPVVHTSLTTAAGFLSFGISPIVPIRAFGLFTGFGVLFCMLWSLTVIPALLVILKPRGFPTRARADAAPSAVATAILRHPLWVLGIGLVVVAASPFGLRRIEVQDSWVSGFSPASDFFRTTRYFNERFLGSHMLLIAVSSERFERSGTLRGDQIDHHTIVLPPQAVADSLAPLGCHIRIWRASEGQPAGSGRPKPGFAARIESVERTDQRVVISTQRSHGSFTLALRPRPDEILNYEISSARFTMPEAIGLTEELVSIVKGSEDSGVGGAIGPADYLATANYILKQRDEAHRVVPGDPDRIALIWDQLQRTWGARRMGQLIDESRDRVLISVFMNDANFQTSARLMRTVREFERTRLKPERMQLSFGGDVAVSETLIDAIVTTQTRSLLASLIGVLLVTSLFLRSLGWGLIALVPVAFSVLSTFAFLGWAGVPLGVATSMFAGMTLGVGDDYAIHFVERYRRARAGDTAPRRALAATFESTGTAIVVDALAVACAFGALAMSQVPANARLGLIAAITILACLVATLLLIPAFLAVYSRRFRDH